MRRVARRLTVASVLAVFLFPGKADTAPPDPDPRRDKSPWGIASGAEWSGEYPRFNPLLSKAGITWIRLFPEWQALQPGPGQWNWSSADALVANCRQNGIHPLGVLFYFASWATSDGSTRRAPLKDLQSWAEYTRGMVARYQKDIKHWEIYNEFNGSFAVSDDKPRRYAELVRTSSLAAKKVDPEALIGLSCANFDLGFFDAVIKAGAAGHFDFICVHPYENLAMAIEGGEDGYLSLAGNLRKLLEENHERSDMPLWITETGFQSTVRPNVAADGNQACALVKAYVLSLAQGFQRIFWFEARGPAYGQGTDHGILRPDWTPRPAYGSLGTLTGLLGAEPQYQGWLNLGGSFGFVFRGKADPVLITWAQSGTEPRISLEAVATVTDLEGRATSLAPGQGLHLTRSPVFITGLSSTLVAQAQSNAKKRFPWGGDYASATEVSCRLAATNVEKGIRQTSPGTTSVVHLIDQSYRRSEVSKGGEGLYVYFRVDPAFVPFNTKDLDVTVMARRVDNKPSGFTLTYESLGGYKGAGPYWNIPEGETWSENTWSVHDANFVGGWGWNFRTDASGSGTDFLIKEVRVKKGARPH